jgi:hypothetical protein
MKPTCDYCQGVSAEGATKCANCGAALGGMEPTDFRVCPHCKRKLLSLGSPACNYCGRALPESYLKARGEMWQRISDVSGRSGDAGEIAEAAEDDNLRRALDALFSLDKPSKP